MSQDHNSESPRLLGRFRELFHLFRQNKEAAVGFVIVSVLLIIAVIVQISNFLHIQVTPYPPLQQAVGPILAPPSSQYLLGTDIFGRDLFSRIVVATPNDVAVGYVVVGSAFLIGSLIGGYAGIRGGAFDDVLMRATDVFFALPVLLFAMAIGAVIGTGVQNMMLVLAIVWWPPYARLARGETLKIAHQSYVEAAHLSGQKPRRVLIRHVLPNIFWTMLVYATLDIGTVILVYSGLSYLGLAVHPPNPDWGEMVSAYHGYLVSAPWLPIFPGVMISLGVIGFSLLGDGVKEALGHR